MPIFDPRPDHVRSVVEKVALRQFLLRVLTSVSPVSVIPSSSSTRCCYQDKWEKRGNLPKNQSSLGSREALDRQVDSIQPEGTAIGQFDQYCQWFPSVLKQILSWYTKFTLHCMVLMQPSPELSSKIPPKCSTGDKSFIIISLSKYKIQPKYSDSSL